jgi:hypothetical protein
MPVSVAAVAVTDRACVAIPLAGHPIATHPPAPPDGLAQPPREVPPQPANATLPTEGTAPAPDEVTEYEGFQALDLEADPAAETVPSAPDSDRGCGDPCPSPLRPAPDAGPAPLRTAEAAPPPAAAALVGAVVAGSLLLWWWLAALLARPARRLHPRAEDLLQAVCAEPGLSFRALRDATGLANGVALHHLRRLLREGRIVSRRHRNTVRFFENHGRYAGTWREATVLRDPLNRRLHEWLAGNRGATQADTVQASRTWGWQRGVTQKRLALLEEAGLLARSRHGRSVRYLAIRPALPTPAATDAAAWTSQPTSAVAKV